MSTGKDNDRAREHADGAPSTRLSMHVDRKIGEAEYLSTLRDSAQAVHRPSLYLHVPFCASRCLNCEKNTNIAHDASVVEHYLDGLDREMDLVCHQVGASLPLEQLFIGGGSPNYLSDAQLIRLMSIVERYFHVDENTETSLQANPKHTSLSQLELLRGLGFKHVRFDVREVDANVQLLIGRSQSLAMLEDVFDNSRSAGFDNVSVDLVYGLPRQSEETMARSVADLARLGPDRVDCVAFNRRARVFRHQRGIDVADMPSLADKLSLFNSIVDGFEDAGYTWVGLDCFARNGDPLVQAQNDGRLSRSWLGYSDHRSEQLIGFGTHAVSELAGLNTQNHFELADWHGALDSGHLPIRGGIRLSAAQQTRRDLLRELMCNLSVNGADVVLEGSNGEFHRFVNDGSMAVRGNRLSITEQGRIALHHLWSDSSSRLRWAIGV